MFILCRVGEDVGDLLAICQVAEWMPPAGEVLHVGRAAEVDVRHHCGATGRLCGVRHRWSYKQRDAVTLSANYSYFASKKDPGRFYFRFILLLAVAILFSCFLILME